MISVHDALSFITPAAQQLRGQQNIMTKPLEEGLSFRLAEPIIAQLTHPPSDMSAMDGYAVKLSDIANTPVTLKLIGESKAGTPFTDSSKSGNAVRIFTGAIVPNGTDTIVIQENTERTDTHVTIAQSQDKPRHIRRAGIDFINGNTLITRDTIITPKHIAVAAAANIPSFSVYRKLKVAILTNGDELKPVGSTLKSGQIINSNGPALTALLKDWGADVINLGTSSDNKDSLKHHIHAAQEADIIVPIGGASVGDHDLVKPVFETMGYKTLFSKVAVKPGKPVWMAQKENQYVLGLPGNPASALVCAYIFLRPLLGLKNSTLRAKLTAPLTLSGQRETFLRGHAHINEMGVVMATPFPKQDSGLITPFLDANALLHCKPQAPHKTAGDMINIIVIDNLSSNHPP